MSQPARVLLAVVGMDVFSGTPNPPELLRSFFDATPGQRLASTDQAGLGDALDRNSRPALPMAAHRSRLSRTVESGKPRVLKEGLPDQPLFSGERVG